MFQRDQRVWFSYILEPKKNGSGCNLDTLDGRGRGGDKLTMKTFIQNMIAKRERERDRGSKCVESVQKV
jgi:hypothetical protein